MSSFFTQYGVSVSSVFQPAVVQVRDLGLTLTVSSIQEEQIQAEAVSLVGDCQSHFIEDRSHSEDTSLQPEVLKLVYVVRSCREIGGEAVIPLPSTTKESPGGLMAYLLRNSSTREQVCFLSQDTFTRTRLLSMTM